MCAPRSTFLIAHRGASRQAPENTLSAFQRALVLGADGIEFDARPTCDGSLVAFHDATLARTTNGHGRLANRSLDEVKKLDAGSWFSPRHAGEKIPTLEEIVLAISRSAILVVEIKTEGIERPVVETLLNLDALSRSILISFHESVLSRLRRISAACQTGFLWGGKGHRMTLQDVIRKLPGLDPNYLCPNTRDATAPLCAFARERDLKVLPWVVNARSEARRLLRLGVDGMITDAPDLVRSIMGSRSL